VGAMPSPRRRLRAEWRTAAGVVVAVEPAKEEIAARAEELAAAYDDAHNRAMMGNTMSFTASDVVAHYASMAANGARQFFLYDGVALAGDGDVRRIADQAGELAILVLDPRAQGRGLGTRFAVVLHALAFRALGLERAYVTILPSNVASRRLFAKLGYTVDATAEARAYADDPSDVAMSLTRGDFERTHAGALDEIDVGALDPG
jgi:RimJ/RimL family protein N-acetyltransferase